MGPPAPALSRGWALLAVAQCSSVSPRPPLANLSFITIFEIWIISSLIRMIKWWFLKILCPERKKWTSNYSKICLYDCQYSHKRTSVCVETVCVKWYPQSPPEMQGGLALKSLWVQADPRGSTWMLIRLHGKGPLFDRALSQAAVGTGGILFVKAERQYPWGHHRADFCVSFSVAWGTLKLLTLCASAWAVSRAWVMPSSFFFFNMLIFYFILFFTSLFFYFLFFLQNNIHIFKRNFIHTDDYIMDLKKQIKWLPLKK